MTSLKIFGVGALAGALACAGVCYTVLKSPKSEVLQAVRQTQISGAKITNKDFNYKGNTIKFRTEAEGKGLSETEIPKKNIPEAAAWMNRIHGIEASASMIYDRDKWLQEYGLTYWHRINSFALGAGVIAGHNLIGGKIGLMHWF
jgi:hypothetical protein